MKKIFCVFLIFLSIINAKDIDVIKVKTLINDKGLNDASNKYEISKYLLLAIADTESELNPFTIGVNEKNQHKLNLVMKYLNIIGCKYVNKRGSSLLGIYPNTYEEARKVLIILQYFKLDNFDIGYSQINIKNIEKLNVDINRLFIDSSYVFNYSGKILTDCWKYNNQKFYKAIECYNKGTNRNKYTYTYANKVLRSYKKIKLILGES